MYSSPPHTNALVPCVHVLPSHVLLFDMHKILDVISFETCVESSLANKLSAAADACYAKCEMLSNNLENIPQDSAEASVYCHDVIVTGMEALRKEADVLEQLTDKSYWPYPTYSDLLYY